jgi:ATP-dependent protease ClpP protease subunit
MLSFLLLLSLAQSNHRLVNGVVNYNEAMGDESAVVEAQADDDKFYVPKITFSEEVNGESVEKTIGLIDAANAADAKAIIIEWDTMGGEIDSGFRLVRAIEESKAPVICVVDDDAVSMGMYLLQACNTRYMTKRASLMTHEAAIGGMMRGHAVSWQNIADALKSVNRGMAEHITRRMTITPEALLDRIRGGAQWWMNWDEALKFHAVDYVVVSVKEVTDSYRSELKPPKAAIPQPPPTPKP